MSTEGKESTRIRSVYGRRDADASIRARYTVFDESYLFGVQVRARRVLSALRRFGISSVQNRRILEVGCGHGGVLLEYLSWGAPASNLHGIDLVWERLLVAKERMPQATILCADGQELPYRNGVFDFVIQYTVFSSILDGAVRSRVAKEMVRVLKRDGLIVWYDFWVNPSNRQTGGVGIGDIRRLYPACRVWFARATLAPPIARRVLPLGWSVACGLESIRILNGHYLAIIQPSP